MILSLLGILGNTVFVYCHEHVIKWINDFLNPSAIIGLEILLRADKTKNSLIHLRHQKKKNLFLVQLMNESPPSP